MVRNDITAFVDPLKGVPIRSRSHYSKKKTATQPVRNAVIIRDEGCIRCGTFFDLTLHHITHSSKGGSNKANNLQTLCAPCHEYIHNVMELESGTPYKRDDDPNAPPFFRTPEDEEAISNWMRTRDRTYETRKAARINADRSSEARQEEGFPSA